MKRESVVTSHDFASRLRKLAAFLESRPEFQLPRYTIVYEGFGYYDDKDGFLAAARAIGSATKEFDKDEIRLEVKRDDFELRLRANRSTVCRKVQEEKWECEPLLSQEELDSVGA